MQNAAEHTQIAAGDSRGVNYKSSQRQVGGD